MDETTSTKPLIGMFLARGTRVHLVEEGGSRTLCGRQTGVNPRYAYPRFRATLRWAEPADVTCPACIKAAAR